MEIIRKVLGTVGIGKPNKSNDIAGVLRIDYGQNKRYVTSIDRVIDKLHQVYEGKGANVEKYIRLGENLKKYLADSKSSLASIKINYINFCELFMILDMQENLKNLIEDIERFNKVSKDGSTEFEKDVSEIIYDVSRKRQLYYMTKDRTQETKTDFWQKYKDADFQEVRNAYQNVLEIKGLTYKEIGYNFSQNKAKKGVKINYGDFEITTQKVGMQVLGVGYSADDKVFVVFGNSEATQMALVYTQDSDKPIKVRFDIDVSTDFYNKKNIIIDTNKQNILLKYKNLVYEVSYENKNRRPGFKVKDALITDISSDGLFGLNMIYNYSQKEYIIGLDYIPMCEISKNEDEDSQNKSKKHIERVIELKYQFGIKFVEFSKQSKHIGIVSNPMTKEYKGKSYLVSAYEIHDIANLADETQKTYQAINERICKTEGKDEFGICETNLTEHQKNEIIAEEKGKLSTNLKVKKLYLGEIKTSDFSNDDNYFVIGGNNGIQLFNLNEGTNDGYLLDQKVCYTKFSPDCKNCFIGIEGGILAILNLENNSVRFIDLQEELSKNNIVSKKSKTELLQINEIAFSNDGKEVVIGFYDTEIIKLKFA